MTDYLISEGHTDINSSTYECHFKRVGVGQNSSVDYWVLIGSPTAKHARILFYLLWERSVPADDGQSRKMNSFNVDFDKEIRKNPAA
eukprot:6213584-Heterocapsa_arctica.AAC.1